MEFIGVWRYFISNVVEINESLIFNRRLIKWYEQNGVFPTTAIDVGANRGQSIKLFKRLNKKYTIYCFEPNKSLSDRLKTKYSHEKSIEIHNMGISSSSGKRKFNETIIHQTSTIEDLNYDSKYLKTKSFVLGIKPIHMIKKSYQIDTITLGDFIANAKIRSIDLIKIDTEGHEMECLKGLWNNGSRDFEVNYIQVEIHDDDMYEDKYKPDDLKALMNDNSFLLVKKIRHGFGQFYDYIFKNSKLSD